MGNGENQPGIENFRHWHPLVVGTDLLCTVGIIMLFMNISLGGDDQSDLCGRGILCGLH